MSRSVRLSIIETALEDVTERLRELPPTRDAEALSELAQRYRDEYASWEGTAPDADARAELVKSVLELNVRVMQADTRGPKS
jgi:hypothetical protein